MELFATFDRNGVFQANVPRKTVHQQGLWHKSSQVFVFNRQGDLLLAQRAQDKDLYPGLWDYSVGEHLQPGETHLAAAHRGLDEELGITNMPLEVLGTQRWVTHSGTGFLDREIQQAFRGCYTGQLRPDPVEVQAVEYVSLMDLAERVTQNADQFTPWLIEDLLEFKLLVF
ncbi:MAG: NUDIX domain-containing protein [bacterium]